MRIVQVGYRNSPPEGRPCGTSPLPTQGAAAKVRAIVEGKRQPQKLPMADRARERLVLRPDRAAEGLLLHQLLLRLLGEVLELEADLRRGDGLAFGDEVTGDLV